MYHRHNRAPWNGVSEIEGLHDHTVSGGRSCNTCVAAHAWTQSGLKISLISDSQDPESPDHSGSGWFHDTRAEAVPEMAEARAGKSRIGCCSRADALLKEDRPSGQPAQ